MESIPFIAWCLEHLNYWVVMLLMTIESSFIPFPSEVVVPPAAYMCATTGEQNVLLVVLAATVGACLGALINYVLARWLGRPLVYRFANSRLGHMCLIDEEKVVQAERYFDKHGALGTFAGRQTAHQHPRRTGPYGAGTLHAIHRAGCRPVEFDTGRHGMVHRTILQRTA